MGANNQVIINHTHDNDTTMSDTKFEMVAKTFQGLEGVLADELTALGAQDVMQGRRMVQFTGDKRLMYQANFSLRTALRVLKPIYKFRSTDADDLYRQVKDFDWSQVIDPSRTFAIDSTVFSESFRHSRFVTYRVKDAIVDHFMEATGKRPSIRITSPDIRLDVHISADEVTISMDSSGEPLYKRGWRLYQPMLPSTPCWQLASSSSAVGMATATSSTHVRQWHLPG